MCGLRKKKSTNLTRGEWFNSQWQAWKPVALGHQGGDYDRCKACYDNPGKNAPAEMERRRDDETATTLAQELERLSRPLARWEELLAHWMSHPEWVKAVHPFGAVEVVQETDPRQTKTRDWRWTFDPTNRLYQKCCWLL